LRIILDVAFMRAFTRRTKPLTQPSPAYIADLKQLRAVRNITQVDLDSIVGVADGYTAKIESGARTLSLNMLGYFAEGLDADVRIIPREDDDMSQGGRKPRAKNFSKDKGSRIENDIVHKLRDAGIDAKRIALSGAAGRFHSHLEHDVRIADTFQCEVKARANGEGFVTLEQWMGTASMLFLRRDRQEAFVFMGWEMFLKLMSAYERERTGAECLMPIATASPSLPVPEDANTGSTKSTSSEPTRRQAPSLPRLALVTSPAKQTKR
jgi:transcriptional regulator with XRE-family HTH domain